MARKTRVFGMTWLLFCGGNQDCSSLKRPRASSGDDFARQAGGTSNPDPSRYGAKDAHVPLDMARDRRDDLDFYFVTEVKIVAE